MKVKVLRQFIDKNTKSLHKINETLNITKERCEAINSTAHGVFVEEIIVKKPNKKATDKVGD